jgi:hypothetical protein
MFLHQLQRNNRTHNPLQSNFPHLLNQQRSLRHRLLHIIDTLTSPTMVRNQFDISGLLDRMLRNLYRLFSSLDKRHIQFRPVSLSL